MRWRLTFLALPSPPLQLLPSSPYLLSINLFCHDFTTAKLCNCLCCVHFGAPWHPLSKIQAVDLHVLNHALEGFCIVSQCSIYWKEWTSLVFCHPIPGMVILTCWNNLKVTFASVLQEAKKNKLRFYWSLLGQTRQEFQRSPRTASLKVRFESYIY